MTFIFVGGCERSGTTFVARQIANAAGGICLPESQFIVRSLIGGYRDFSRAVMEDWRLTTWPTPVDVLRRKLTLLQGLPPAAVIRELASTVVPATGHAVIVESSPWNLRYRSLLAENFPNSFFVHVLRDGRAVYSSVRPLEWGPRKPMSAATWWESSIAPGLLARGSNRFAEVRFERMLLDQAAPENVLSDLGVMSGSGPKRPTAQPTIGEYTKEQHSLVGGDPRLDRVDGWRRTLSSDETRQFESIAGPTLRSLGYQPIYPQSLAGRWERTLDTVGEAAWMVTAGGTRRVLRRVGHHRRSRATREMS